jgi:hypothetical protein
VEGKIKMPGMSTCCDCVKVTLQRDDEINANCDDANASAFLSLTVVLLRPMAFVWMHKEVLVLRARTYAKKSVEKSQKPKVCINNSPTQSWKPEGRHAIQYELSQ